MGRSAWTIFKDLCRTAERDNVTTIAGVPDIGSSTILRYLDRGIMGIWVRTSPPRPTPANSCRRAISVCRSERSFGANRGTTTMPGLPTRRRTTLRQTNICWSAPYCKTSLPRTTSTPSSRSRFDLYSIGPTDLRGRFRSALKDQRFESVKRVGTASGCPRRARILRATTSSRCSTSQQEEP